MTLKGHKKFWGKLTAGFQFSQKKIGEISWSRQVGQNFKFHWLDFLKDKLHEQKTDTVVSNPGTNGLWNVWGKTDS